MSDSVLRVTVLQQTVSDVTNLQQVLVEVFLHSSVNSPAHHLHTPLCPVLNIVPVGNQKTKQGEENTQPYE